ncbi:MAG: hypothetical protein JKX71_13240 [Amylibacter sp.]|nr:hypothetical protein [Amylibacter sp.]
MVGMKPNQLIPLHMEYRHRFKVEFEFLLQQSTFAKIVFKNSDLLFKDEDSAFFSSLHNLFGCSFEGMALGLSRVWDVRQGDVDLISIPNLVTLFSEYNFLGCRSLREGEADRNTYEALYSDPLRGRLRVVRTEAFAHNIQVGTSKDRKKSDIKGMQEFNLINGAVLEFCAKTINLLYSLNNQLNLHGFQKGKSLDDLKVEYTKNHIAFLRHFAPDIVEP